jgi:aspartate carbamoyltransferase regulatory subunit
MTVDPKGTLPGLAVPAESEKPVTVNIRCKNSRCTSVVAEELKIPTALPGQHLYRCVTCHHTWGIALGGEFVY